MIRPLAAPALLAFAVGCGEPPESKPSPEARAELLEELGFSPGQWRRVLSMAEVPDLPPDPTNRLADDTMAAEFGHHLFFDPRLSGNGRVSCATCHDPALDFTDGRRVSIGVSENIRNAPTVLNTAYHRWLTWDGRADSLWAQALEPLENDVEMGGDRVAILRTVAADPELSARYESLFGPLPELASDRVPEHARPRRDGGRDE